MFWPARKHKFGWYLEPTYDYGFGSGHEQSIGMSAGLLIAIPSGSCFEPRHFRRCNSRDFDSGARPMGFNRALGCDFADGGHGGEPTEQSSGGGFLATRVLLRLC